MKRLFLLLVAALALLVPVVAGATHDTGAFELDGNAISGTADDWERVCHQATTGAECASASDTNGATVAWTADGSLNNTIFTGGGSKDGLDINQWRYKTGAVPDKANLLHAFAARYSLPPDSTPPTLCPSNGLTCEVLFLGSDRLDNSGDAQQGFWFFQNRVTLGNTPKGGVFTFNGVHRAGDILLISEFINGGTTSTISVYRWNPAVKGNLEQLFSNDAATCSTAPPRDAACGLVNDSAALTTSPWSFLDKSGNANFAQGEFFEGGINLSTLGLAGECFTSVLAETRSSTSTTAPLKDFVLGQFVSPGCGG